MKQRCLTLFSCCLLVASLSHFTGCVAVVAGGAAVAGTAYALGDFSVPVEASAEQLEQAIKLGGLDLGLQFINGSGNAKAGSYRFRNADDQKITVSYKTMSPVYYEMSTRVDTFGDKALSQRLSQAILKHL